jgi:transcriptional regulator with XRE-family HTH domain
MELTPGKRLQAARELMGISRSDFAALLNMKYLRLVTIENDRGRMAIDDLEPIARRYPELLHWLVLSEPLDAAQLQNSSNQDIQKLADNLETHGLPEV